MITREEVLAMEVGEELNILVAIEVMKWRPICIGKGYHHTDKEQADLAGWYQYGITYIAQFNWKPSTDILAAWRVKERLNADGLLLALDDLCPTGEQLVRVEFWDNAGLVPSKVVGEAEGKTAPEAICKAALLTTLGVK